MLIDTDVIDYGPIDISALQEYLTVLPEDYWTHNTMRQDLGSVNDDTQTIILRFAESDPRWFKQYAQWGEFADLIVPIWREVMRMTEFSHDGVLNRTMMPRLKPGGAIPTHRDVSDALQLSHRMHIPVMTNEKCMFSFGEPFSSSHNLKEGRLYEVNNVVEHGVVNGGDTPRIHLMFDYYEH